jgi:hypothetical protein
MSKGWECPKCGAVMAPWQKVCVNCTGNAGWASNVKIPDASPDVRIQIDSSGAFDSAKYIPCSEGYEGGSVN